MERSNTQLNPYEKKLQLLKLGKRLCGGAVVFGFVTSAGGNILHAVEQFAASSWMTKGIAVVLAALIPTIFGLMFEIASRIFFRKEAHIVMKLIAFTGALGISGITAWNSYFHQRDAFSHFGDQTQAFLLPLAIDGLMIIGSVYLIEVGFQIRDLEAQMTGIRVKEARPAKPTTPTTKRDKVVTAYNRWPHLPIADLAKRVDVSYNYAYNIIRELQAAPAAPERELAPA